MEPWQIGLLVGAGALAYNVWGFIQAYSATKNTSAYEVWDPLRSLMTVVPSLVAGFLAGYNMTPSSVGDLIGLVVAGFGVAAATGKLGINSFFSEKK